MKKIILSVSAFMLSMQLMAQAPEKMSYQAVIRNSSNALVQNGSVGMRISILEGSASGTPVYVETQSATTNNNGLASVTIGSGTVVSGNISTIDWSGDNYFLKTETDPTGGTNYTITGTSQLLSVPYALHAKTAESVINDQVDDADADPSNEIELPTGGNSAQVLSTDGSGNYSWVDQPANELPTGGNNAQVLSTDGTGTYSWVDQTVNTLPDGTAVGQTARWNGSAWVVDATLYNDGSNIGIGTTTPTDNLTVDVSTLGGGITLTGLTPGYKLNSNGALGAVNIPGEWANGSNTNDIVLRNGDATSGIILATGASTDARMTITSAGNVGVGTTAPTQKLDVAGNVKFSGALMPNNAAGTAGQVLTSGGAGSAPTWTTPASSTNLYSSDGTLSGNRTVTQGANTLSFTSSAVNAFNVDAGTLSVDAANNRVGIGTATPNAQLQLGSTLANRKLVLFENSNNDHEFYGWGMSASLMKYQIASTLASHAFYAAASPSSSTELMRIQGNGNVGIGTAAPGRTLDVNGVTRSTTTTGAANAAGQFQARAGGTAQGQRAVYSFYPTFEATGDNQPRRAADILAGYNGGAWGGEFLAFHVGGGNDLEPLTGERMRITVSGNVGIGTTTPFSKLSIGGSATASLVFNPTAVISDNTAEVLGLQGAAGGSNINFYKNGSTARQAIIGTSTNGLGADIGFRTTSATGAADQPRMIIKADGNVGIGTNAPVRTLHVNAVMRLEPTTAPASPAKGDMYMDSTTNKLMVFDGTVWQACW